MKFFPDADRIRLVSEPSMKIESDNAIHMRFITDESLYSVIVTAKLPNKDEMSKAIHSYEIVAPELFRDKWFSVESTKLTMLPLRYQTQIDEEIYDEIRTICGELPNQAERRFFIIFAKKNPANLINKKNQGITSRLSSYSAEGIKLLVSDFNEEIERCPDVNLQGTKTILEEILAQKLEANSSPALVF